MLFFIMSITLIPSTLARISRGPVGWTLKETLNFHQRWHRGIRGIIQKPYGNVHVKNPEKSHSDSVASNILNQFFFKRLRLHVNRNQQKHCCCYCQERCKNPHVTLPILIEIPCKDGSTSICTPKSNKKLSVLKYATLRVSSIFRSMLNSYHILGYFGIINIH